MNWKGLASSLAWTTFARYQQEVIPARANQVIDCINYSWTLELDVKLWIQHSLTLFPHLSSLLTFHYPQPPPLIWPHEAVGLVCKPLSTANRCIPKAPNCHALFLSSNTCRDAIAVRVSAAGFALAMSLGNVVATLSLQGRPRIPYLWELQQSSSLDSA